MPELAATCLSMNPGESALLHSSPTPEPLIHMPRCFLWPEALNKVGQFAGATFKPLTFQSKTAKLKEYMILYKYMCVYWLFLCISDGLKKKSDTDRDDMQMLNQCLKPGSSSSKQLPSCRRTPGSETVFEAFRASDKYNQHQSAYCSLLILLQSPSNYFYTKILSRNRLKHWGWQVNQCKCLQQMQHGYHVDIEDTTTKHGKPCSLSIIPPQIPRHQTSKKNVSKHAASAGSTGPPR